MFSQLVKSAFTQMQQSRGKINTMTFICHLLGYLTAAWPWEALLPSEDGAAIFSYPFPSLNICQDLKDKGAKRGKSIDEELRMENWKGIKLQRQEEELGVYGLQKRFKCRRRNEDLGLQNQRWGGEEGSQALPRSAYPPCLHPLGCHSNEPQVLDEF